LPIPANGKNSPIRGLLILRCIYALLLHFMLNYGQPPPKYALAVTI